VNTWRTRQVKKRWSPEHLAMAEALCARIDELWEQYARDRAKGLARTRCVASAWPDPVPQEHGPSLAEQEAVKARLEAQSGAFQRLRLLMDAWCALYFWPIESAAALPTRDAWLAAAEVLLGIGVQDPSTRALLDVQLGEDVDLDALFNAVADPLPDATAVAEAVPWFAVTRDVAGEQPFHHWELVFTEVLGPSVAGLPEPRGFDLMFGNPPWVKVSWKDAPLLAEYEPLLGVREARSADYNRARTELLERPDRRLAYRAAFQQGEGVGVFLNDRTLYPALAGVQTNLYKNFIERSWALLGSAGLAGLLHPEGVFDDPKGGVFRERYYERLLAHYQLKNERILFSDVHHVMAFSINVYRGGVGEPRFSAMFNLFDPRTIAQSQRHAASYEPIPGIKGSDGSWETRGHTQRILTITDHELALFASLFEDADTPPRQARLPQVHSQPLLRVLEKFAAAPRRLGDLRGEYLATEMFHEANAQRDGIITRQDSPSFEPQSADEWVVSGPHFFVGTQFNKTPRSRCTANGHYDDIDLTDIPDDYLPRAVYRPGDRNGDLTAFYAAIPEWPKPSKPVEGRGGFWPVSDEEVPAYEALLGEPLRRYGVDPDKPGAQTARKFAFFVEWEGDVEGALKGYAAAGRPEEVTHEYGDLRIAQAEASSEDLRALPRPLTSYPRYVHRRRGQPANERNLIAAVLPPGVSHIHPVISVAFTHLDSLLVFAGHTFSIVWDFLIKMSGRGDVYASSLKMLPIGTMADEQIKVRALRLSCVSVAFEELWANAFRDDFRSDSWALADTRLFQSGQLDWSALGPGWERGCALRNDLAKRQALLEIDVLVALALNLSIDELIQIYEVQFPVMKAYEEADRYDARGRRLPNTARKDAGGRELRDALADHDGQSSVTVSWTIDNGQREVTRTFHPPFTPADRIEDYRVAYRVFSERFAARGAE
jgi:hypothetical protein